MLKQLNIRNIILVESADIPFEEGFNVLSGETGAGKSAIMNALGLVAGDRTDITALRKDAEKGSVEAIFEIEKIPNLKKLLEERGIEHCSDEELIIRREILSSGRSRAFVNNQAVQLHFLKEISAFLFDIVGQHANQQLLSLDSQRKILDTFGDLHEDVNAFTHSWEQENSLRKDLDNLINNEAQRLRDIDKCQYELEELNNANLKENEDETLFAEFSLLSNSEELTSKLEELSQMLSGERNAVLTQLTRHRTTFEKLVRIDNSLTELFKSYDSACLELHEISHSLTLYQNRIEHNPERAAHVSERLSLIERLKRRYGSSISEIIAYKNTIEEKLKHLESADQQIETLKSDLQKIEKQNDTLCRQLTKKRKAAAEKLERKLTEELRLLNMPKAEFHVIIEQQKRSSSGDDKLEFFLSPNVGEKQIPVKECASGGELSRLMLALQTILAGKTETPTMIFDEIDANIGGSTATIVGEKLREIGKSHQILCITHFPQVAKHGQQHLQVSKKEVNGRTISVITVLNSKLRKQELCRMIGS